MWRMRSLALPLCCLPLLVVFAQVTELSLPVAVGRALSGAEGFGRARDGEKKGV